MYKGTMDNNRTPPQPTTWLWPKQVAEWLGVSEATLAKWRRIPNKGPPYVVVGLPRGRPRYSLLACEKWARSTQRG